MEAILHKIQNFITGFMLVNSNLAKAVEFIEYGTYISVGVILLGLLGFFGLAKKNNALIKAVGAASLFALFPAWFIIGEMGLIGLLAVIFIVSIVLNRQSPDTRGRNFLLSSMLAGFAISIVSFFIGYNYLKEGHEIDPSENGVYGLAPFMVFLVSFLVFRRRDKKAEIYHNEMEEEPWQMGRESVASASMSAVPSSRVTFEPIEEKRGYPSEEERLPSLEELFSKGAEDGSFETIFSARAEEPAKEAVRAEVEEVVSEGVTELATDQEALSASLISEASAAVAETIEMEMTSDLSVGSRSDEIAADLSDTPEGSVAKDIPETLGLQDDLSQTLVLDDLSKQLSEVLGSTKLADE
ncbi:MAG: hypothetical protein Q4A75_07685, partial [Peptostreptococcaceae bacterium]|nr:hypothetical protein [Peptostreptococcaceae bacterium]